MNRNRVKITIKALLATLLMVFANTMTARAADDEKQGSSMTVGVSAVIPENQIDKEQSYFDLLMTPGQEQVLDVNLSNSSDEDITVNIYANTAVTNDNGVVDYSMEEKEKDSTLKHSFSEISQVENEMVIPKKSSVVAKVNVKMPAEAYKGVITGGIYVSEKESKKKEEESTGGVQIKNKFVYVLGVQLRNDASLEGMLPEMKMDPAKILPTHVNYRNFLGINLQNTEPLYIRDLQVEAKIYKGNSTEPLHETKRENMKMAPNSNFNFGVDWENKEFQGGKYRAVVVAKSLDYDKEWKFETEFTIDAKLAEKLNKEAIELEKDYMKWIIMGAIALLVLLILVIVLIIMVNKRNKAKRKAERRKRQSKSNRSKSTSSKRK